MSSSMNPVVVYSNNTCPNCDNLKKALKFKGIPFEEINIGDKPDQATMLRDKGYRQLPVMQDNGQWMSGFTPSNFAKIVQARAVVTH